MRLKHITRLSLLAVFIAIHFCDGNPTGAQEVADGWRYTTQRPQDGWESSDFDDSAWKQGAGGFGTRDTPAARVGTVWGTNDIWLRKTIELKQVPDNVALLMHHDEDVEVFINGDLVTALKGYTVNYNVFPIADKSRSSIKAGKNVVAVHCHQTGGGQFIDVHVVDADNVPKLPRPKRSTKPFQSELITKWGESVTPENAWTEYPRPRLKRDNWTNLNGSWDYAITPVEQALAPKEWNGKILVPYCLESKLGGVSRILDATEALWYRRTVDLQPRADKRLILNFEAVDYRCTVFLNGTPVGKHVGGNTPFSFDVTDAAQRGKNELVVRVEDETEAWQLRGKQVLEARGIWYTQVSGIWQTVWMEEVPARHIKDLKISTDAEKGRITIRPSNEGGQRVKLVVRDGDRVVAEGVTSDELAMQIPGAKLWSPDSPHLYSIAATLVDDQGNTLDEVESYAGIRTVGKVKGPDGHWRFTLNGEEIFHWGPLDQGWWPDGLLTPPSDEAMLFDIQRLKDAGFNMIRKHIKVEPRRYYYHCDRLGMMVWQDQVSGGEQPPWTRLKPDPVDAEWPDEQHDQFMVELERMIATLESHPSIVCWVPFNESWGQHRTMDVGQWTVKRDPSRLVNIASGGNFWPVGDIVDAHAYPHPQFPFDQGEGGRFDDYIKVMGEFGGHGYPVQGHLWDANRRNWGYGGLPKNEAEYKERYVTSLNRLNELRRKGIAGGVYTQTTDVEGEINGLMTYDRKVIKIPAKELAELHQVLFDSLKKPKQTSANEDRSSRSGLGKVKQTPDLVYATVGGQELQLDLHVPTSVSNPPLMVWIHGGGWRGGSRKKPRLLELTHEGYAVASISYRLTDTEIFPAQIHDCKGAIRWLRANAKRFGYNAERIAVAGSSAGGHLALLAGTSGGVKQLEGDIGGNLDQSSTVQAVIDYYGPSDFVLRGKTQPDRAYTEKSGSFALLGGLRDGKLKPEMEQFASPVTYVSADDPPLLIFQGDADKTVLLDQSQRIHDLYQAAGLDSQLIVLKNAGHGGKGFFSGESFEAVKAFLERHRKR